MQYKSVRVARGAPALLRAGKGLSLIEVAVATAIIGIGVAALLVAVAAGTRTNHAGKKLTQAVFLAQEIREWTVRLPFCDPEYPSNPVGPDAGESEADDLDDLMGAAYSPPRDGQGSPIADMTGWSETITLTWRNPDHLTAVVPDGTSDVVHVEVNISYQGTEVLNTGWIVIRKE